MMAVKRGSVLLVCVLVWTPLVFGAGDWTECPTSCRCKWVSGKKVAECTGAGFTAVPNTLSSEIQVLDLSGNNIRVLTKDAFKSVGLVNLHKIYLHSCNIREIDKDAFHDLKIMIELDLSHNNISSIHRETFKGNDRLRVLILSENPIQKLESYQFPVLPHLKSLELQKCQLQSIDKKAFGNVATLENLKLNDNRLSYLRDDVFVPLTKLKSLSLENNPWRCDCKLKDFRDWILERKLFSVPTACAEPERLAGRLWDQMGIDDFACKPEIQVPEEIVYGNMGGNVTLSCIVVANPAPEIKWVQNGRVLTNLSHIPFGQQTYIIREEGGIERWTNLTVTKIDDQDAGEYTCVARNAGGVAERNVTLLFPDSPLIPADEREVPVALIAGVAAGAVFLIIVAVVLCCCVSRCRQRRQANKAKARPKLNGSITVAYPDQEKQLLEVNPIKKPPRVVHGNYEGVPQTDVELAEISRRAQFPPYPLAEDAGPPSYVASERFDDVAAGEPLSVPTTSVGTMVMTGMEPGIVGLYYPVVGLPPSTASRDTLASLRTPETASLRSAAEMTHDVSAQYPDLLDIPARAKQSSPSSSVSTAPDTSRLIGPQQLNPAHLQADPRSATLPYPPHLHQPHSRSHSPAYYPMPPFTEVPQPIVAARPGYVTLPRKPRVPSWSGGGSPAAGSASPPPVAVSPVAGSTSSAVVKVEPMYDNLGPRTTADGSSWLALDDIAHDVQIRSPPPAGMRTSFSLPPYHPPIQETKEPQHRGTPPPVHPKPSPRPVDKQPSAVPEERLSIISNGQPPSGPHAATASPPKKVPPKVPPKPPPKPKKTGSVSADTSLASVPEGQSFYEDEGEDGTEV